MRDDSQVQHRGENRGLFEDRCIIFTSRTACRESAPILLSALFSRGKKKSSTYGPYLLATFHMLAVVHTHRTLLESTKGHNASQRRCPTIRLGSGRTRLGRARHRLRSFLHCRDPDGSREDPASVSQDTLTVTAGLLHTAAVLSTYTYGTMQPEQIHNVTVCSPYALPLLSATWLLSVRRITRDASLERGTRDNL